MHAEVGTFAVTQSTCSKSYEALPLSALYVCTWLDLCEGVCAYEGSVTTDINLGACTRSDLPLLVQVIGIYGLRPIPRWRLRHIPGKFIIPYTDACHGSCHNSAEACDL